MTSGKVEVWLAGNGRWYFHKRNRNGKITHPSQGYTTKGSATRAARRELPGLPIVEPAARTRVPPS